MNVEYLPILTPSEGMMLTNGEVWSEKVYVGRADSPDNWREAPIAEYEAWQAEREKLAQQPYEPVEVEPTNTADNESDSVD